TDPQPASTTPTLPPMQPSQPTAHSPRPKPAAETATPRDTPSVVDVENAFTRTVPAGKPQGGDGHVNAFTRDSAPAMGGYGMGMQPPMGYGPYYPQMGTMPTPALPPMPPLSTMPSMPFNGAAAPARMVQQPMPQPGYYPQPPMGMQAYGAPQAPYYAPPQSYMPQPSAGSPGVAQ